MPYESKSRYWSFIVIPDIVPSNWRDILNGFHFKWYECPIHDHVVNSVPHYHCLICFPILVTRGQVTELLSPLSGFPEIVFDPIAVLYYFSFHYHHYHSDFEVIRYGN